MKKFTKTLILIIISLIFTQQLAFAQSIWSENSTSIWNTVLNKNVGIGTATPSETLDVLGNIKTGGSITISSNGGRYTNGSIFSDANWGMIFRAATSSPTLANFMWADSANNELMRISNNGNLTIQKSASIGTTLQIGFGSGTLHYGNNGLLLKPNTGDRALMELHSPDGTNRLVLQSLSGASYLSSLDAKPLLLQSSGGNVGIGTASPLGKLHIVDNHVNIRTSEGSSNGWSKNSLTIEGNPDSKYSTLKITSGHAAVIDRGLLNIDRAGNSYMYVRMDGNVGIGTITPNQKLSVNGTIQAKEILVNTGWSDFVFDNNYKLRPLTEVEQFVKTNKHLPEIPSQQEVEKNGVQLGDISSKLLMKIEELTLYIIEQQKQITILKQNIQELQKK